ncbi:NAD(P)-binding protein [Haloactinomyces albus]|uniref:NADPH-dependent 2,4-dienoyl-CoA reductase/sulfur reductase-like enzyme n=1 Tax=Haloactinomyces albus TaxID=1352928 RepID=A0AAE4CNZ6_9ACTN|nr:NAD(P)-binding protein [Haloactinomyces albus]MDR7303941.1 NADPH-dependent 2,4-dienoyl-CoA reductase/sulfur reductase-like enzyme [Haloactinomyces albus]
MHTGRINTIDAAERVLADGHADMVGMARAHIADGEILSKAREGRTDEIRPCIGGNDCISRRYVEGLPFGCAVNPHAAKELDGPWGPVARPRRLMVVGGGPAGMELAALAAEGGHAVDLWEAADELGGQLRVAAAAPSYDQYSRYLDWQERRLERLEVKIRLGECADADAVITTGTDVVAVATGATPHRPLIKGIHGENVFDIREVLRGDVSVGQRVLVVAQDDHLPPLSVTDFLSERGHDVTMVYATTGPGQLLGRYILGGILGRLHSRGVVFRFMEEVTEIAPDRVRVANVYSRCEEELTGFDSVVLACGGDADAELYDQLRTRMPEVHLLGDAFAPRRLVSATRQAYELAKVLRA